MDGFSIQPSDLRSGGSTLDSLGSHLTSGGTKLADTGSKLASAAGRDNSGIGSAIAKAFGKGMEVTGKVFSEGGRVASASSKRLHANADSHQANESTQTSKFRGLHDNGEEGHTKPSSSAGGGIGKSSGSGGGKGFHNPRGPQSDGGGGSGHPSGSGSGNGGPVYHSPRSPHLAGGPNGPKLIENGSAGGMSGNVMKVGDKSGLDILHGGKTTPQSADPARAAHPQNLMNPNPVSAQNHSWPSAPQQGPAGTGGISQGAHNHVSHGEYKPPFTPTKGKNKGKTQPAGASGGHVAQGDIHTPGGVNGHGRPYGGGVATTGPATGSTVAANGVYDIKQPDVQFPSMSGNVTKPGMSSMFPPGMPDTAVHGVGNQAFNHGNPSGGITTPNPHQPNNGSWSGSGQVPFTPNYDPGHSNHGSGGLIDPANPAAGSYNHPSAGQNINVQGYANQDPAQPGKWNAATYFPPTANQPPTPPPFDYIEPKPPGTPPPGA